MTANFVREPTHMRWTNGTGSDVASGGVVPLTNRCGIAQAAIANGAAGVLLLTGVYDLAMAAEDIAQDARVYWDATAGAVTATVTDNTFLGYAHEGKSSGAATIEVRLCEPGAVLAGDLA